MLWRYIKLFLKKRDLELVSLPNFVHAFWRKIFFLLSSVNWPNVIAWLHLPLEILGHMCIGITLLPVCDVTNFEINLSFLIKPFLCKTKKVRRNVYISYNEKHCNKKHFSSFLKGFQLPEDASDPRVGL